jgi:hypothetical protein
MSLKTEGAAIKRFGMSRVNYIEHAAGIVVGISFHCICKIYSQSKVLIHAIKAIPNPASRPDPPVNAASS